MVRKRPPVVPDPGKSELQAGSAAAVAFKLQQALDAHQRGQLAQAGGLYREVLARLPEHFDALHLLGVLELQRKHAAAAAELIGRAISIDPDSAEAHSNFGIALRDLGRSEEALASFERALRLKPDYAEAHLNRGAALRDLKRHEEALASCDRALALRRDYPEALFNRANALVDLRRHEEALASYERALALNPRHLKAHINLGNALRELRRYEDALACYERVLALQPDYFAEMHYNCGNVLQDLGRQDEAVARYDRALAARPAYPDALDNRGNALMKLKRPEEAARTFAKLLELAQDYGFAKGALLHAKMLCCDWEGLSGLAESIEGDIRAGRRSAEPFGHQAIARSAQALKRCAEIYGAEKFPPAGTWLWNGERYENARIRLGYVSGEFHQQATSILMVELFERHDRNRFELVAFDNGRDDGSEIRGRLERAFDEMVDINRLGDREAAAAINRRKIDILVNLNGYFGRSRQGIFALRPSPVQVNYLGFPGTIGAAYIDYILADTEVIPPGEEACYTEKVVYLPDTYQANDSRRRIAERAPTRAEAGLPGDGFVFCCFNNNYKITPDMFDIWMRLLNKVPGSVLWLLEGNDAASRNLRREAEARGVAADRLVFARMIQLDEHLARHRLADLFLDTLPYNAHTTGSDALWAGLPLLTCRGTTFPGRVAASLLKAVGLPELITATLDEYEALALALATDPARLAEIRAKLARNRATHPLFDTERFRRHIEAAYVSMWERAERGEPPASFAVQP